MKMTKTRMRALRGVHLGFYFHGPKGRWNVKGPEHAALNVLVAEGYFDWCAGTGQHSLSTKGLAALDGPL